MNIFILDTNPTIAAQMQCDKHINKMIQESAQMLVTAHVAIAGFKPLGACEPTHPNHPCCVWVRESTANYKWLYQHFCALLDEWSWRSRGRKSHDYERMRRMLSSTPPMARDAQTPFVVTMPDKYKCKSPVKSYRKYYKFEKQPNIKPFRYTRRDRPLWLTP